MIWHEIMILEDGTEIDYSERLDNGEVHIFIEKYNNEESLKSMEISLPEYKVSDVEDFSEEEIERYINLIKSNEHLIMKFSELENPVDKKVNIDILRELIEKLPYDKQSEICNIVKEELVKSTKQLKINKRVDEFVCSCGGKTIKLIGKYIVKRKDYTIVIDNVFYDKCNSCGEQYYNKNVEEQLENMVTLIENKLNTLKNFEGYTPSSEIVFAKWCGIVDKEEWELKEIKSLSREEFTGYELVRKGKEPGEYDSDSYGTSISNRCFCNCTRKLIDSKNNDFSNFGNTITFIKDIPCQECEHCGEVYYDYEIVQRLIEIEETMSDMLKDKESIKEEDIVFIEADYTAVKDVSEKLIEQNIKAYKFLS